MCNDTRNVFENVQMSQKKILFLDHKFSIGCKEKASKSLNQDYWQILYRISSLLFVSQKINSLLFCVSKLLFNPFLAPAEDQQKQWRVGQIHRKANTALSDHRGYTG